MSSAVDRPVKLEPDHRQVDVDGVLVDEGLAPLLRHLWRCGFRTQFSCQCRVMTGAVDTYIIFWTLEDAFRFFERTVELLYRHDWRLFKALAPGEPLRPQAKVAVRTMLITDPLEKMEWTRLRGCVEFNPELLPLVTELWLADVAV